LVFSFILLRRLMIKRSPNESIGITLRGSRPAIINSIDPNSPADLCGLFENDVILAVNDIDVEYKTHCYLVEFLKTAGLNPIIDVMQKQEYEMFNNFTNRSSSLSSCSQNSMQIFEIRNHEGKTFKEKVNN
jgi:C-terminal processing protease CtpA/Prc